MESGRFLLAVILMIAVMVVTNLLFRPDRAPTPAPADSTAVDSAGETASEAAPPGPSTDTSATQIGPAEAVPTATQPAPAADTTFLQTDLLRLGFGPGGALLSARLLEYESFDESAGVEERVELAQRGGDGLLRPQLRVGQQLLPLRLVAETGSDTAAGSIRFAWREGNRSAQLTYTIPPDSYILRARLETSGLTESPQLLLGLPSTLRVNEADPNEDRRALAYVVNSAREGIESVNLRSIDEERVDNGPFTWVAVKNKYFLVAAIADSTGLPFGGVRASPVAAENAADLVASLPAAGGETFAFDLYVGPQVADRLAAVGHGLEDVNPYGWSLFRPILRPIGHAVTWALVGLHNTLGIGYGWVLILFGVLIRVVLWPLNARSMRAQLKNMELQPRIKEIQEKYKGSPEVMQKEMMKLYKEGFNPFGGCLPLLIPFPVLIALFFVFQSTIEFRGVEFLWLPDLSRFDPLYILPLLLGSTMFLQQWITSKSTPSNMNNPQMKMMMYFMPIFMTVIFLRFASGLNLYYVAQNIASIPQQVLLMRERKRWHASKR